MNLNIYHPPSPLINSQVILPDPINLLLDKLSKCESNQIPDVVIMDSNNKESYGFLQFQRQTFDYFGEKYGLPHDDILSPEQQFPIAYKMIEDGLGPANWVVCWNRITRL